MAKGKGRELRKYGVGELGERPARGKSPSSKRLAEGNSCGLRADAGRYWRQRAGWGAGPGGRAAEVRAARGGGVVRAAARRGGNCTARRAPAVSGAPSSSPPTHSAPPTPLSSSSQLPRPLLLAEPRQRGSTVRVSCWDEVTHPWREVIWMLPW